jgi:DNA invertase Pin-like site-specific DNA recombinase
VKVPATTWDIAFSYLRYSSPTQKEGDSVDRQTRLRESWLKRNPKVRLDTSIRMIDAGVSGYSGAHRTKPKHALASFLDLVQRGRVPVGSYLIVENLDRLTRENPVISIPAVLNLIAAGIRVVQLTPVEMVYDGEMEQHHLMNMLWELSRGHAESKRKSGLCGQAWGEKKKKAREDKTPHGRACPAWLELEDGKYRVKEDAACAIRKIYKWCVAGLGMYAILDRLNAEAIPSFGSHSGLWERSYIRKILSNEAIIGVYQPFRGRYPNRRPEGEPVRDYYPRVIDDKTYYAAQEAIRLRTGKTGRPPADKPANVFSGLLWSGMDGAKLHVHSANNYQYLVSVEQLNRRSGVWRTFPLQPFSTLLLRRLCELEASELFDDPNAKQVSEVTNRLHDVEKRLSVAVAKFEADPESPTWADRVSQYDQEKRSLVRQLNEAQRAAAQPLSVRWSEARALMLAEEEPDRLRAALLATISGVWCVFVRRGIIQLAAVQVWFNEGSHRDYLIAYRRPVAGRTRQEAVKKARTLADLVKLGPLDLRQKQHAERLEKALLSIDAHKLINRL